LSICIFINILLFIFIFAFLSLRLNNVGFCMFRLPVRGESIPVRLFLGGFDLTPTYVSCCYYYNNNINVLISFFFTIVSLRCRYRSIEQKFSLKYYLNLVLVDEVRKNTLFSYCLLNIFLFETNIIVGGSSLFQTTRNHIMAQSINR
jgi:hypothetical protein